MVYTLTAIIQAVLEIGNEILDMEGTMDVLMDMARVSLRGIISSQIVDT